MIKTPLFFGIRHLSPAGAFHLRELFNKNKPELVLIECPSDFNDQIYNITRNETKPPIAILAYTNELPVKTILYPLAEYSPEYQAILWCCENNVKCEFVDLPSDVFLAIERNYLKQGADESVKVYEELDKKAGEDGHETFWERTFEHTLSTDTYINGVNTFGQNIRDITSGIDSDWAEIVVREAYMSRKIVDAINSGIKPENIVVITGAYHVEGLINNVKRALSGESLAVMSDEEIKTLPKIQSNHTLMPYSFYRLSSRSGYGAGNKAPAYYNILWNSLKIKNNYKTAYSYLSKIAQYQRKNGSHVSSAEVIEAVRLAISLAEIRSDNSIPSLRDLRDAAVTCMAGGSIAQLSLAIADTEIGTDIGSLPEGVSRTSLQDDFYRQLKELKLDKYKSIVSEDLRVD